MLRSFFCSRRWALWAWGGLALLLASIVAEVQILVVLNSWYRETWDLLGAAAGFEKAEERVGGLRQFGELLVKFCMIVFPFILVRVLSHFLAQHYAFRWRQAISFAYRPFWEKTEKEIEGASQRMQEDTRDFADILENLGLGFFRAVLTLFAFLPILWTVSEQLTQTVTEKKAPAADGGLSEFESNLAGLDDAARAFVDSALAGVDFVTTVPGSLVWVAIVTAVAGTVLSYLVGIKLPGLHYNNQRVEALFRKRMAYAEDDKLFADMPNFVELFTGLRFNYFRLFLHTTYFRLWENFFFQFLIIVDFILIGPGILVGLVTLGVLNQVSHAFSKVSESFAYLVQNWLGITKFLSIIKRLREFERNIGYSGAGGDSAVEGAQVVR